VDEIIRHEPEKGFGWYDYKHFEWWDSALETALYDYLFSKDPTQLIDIANFCAMIWWNRVQSSTQEAKKE